MAIKELIEMAPESALRQLENGEFEEIESMMPTLVTSIAKTGVKKYPLMALLYNHGVHQRSKITGEAIAERGLLWFMLELSWKMELYNSS